MSLPILVFSVLNAIPFSPSQAWVNDSQEIFSGFEHCDILFISVTNFEPDHQLEIFYDSIPAMWVRGQVGTSWLPYVRQAWNVWKFWKQACQVITFIGYHVKSITFHVLPALAKLLACDCTQRDCEILSYGRETYLLRIFDKDPACWPLECAHNLFLHLSDMVIFNRIRITRRMFSYLMSIMRPY